PSRGLPPRLNRCRRARSGRRSRLAPLLFDGAEGLAGAGKRGGVTSQGLPAPDRIIDRSIDAIVVCLTADQLVRSQRPHIPLPTDDGATGFGGSRCGVLRRGAVVDMVGATDAEVNPADV